MSYTTLLWALFFFYVIWWIYFFLYQKQLEKKELDIRRIFISRSDTITSLFEVTKPYLERHDEIFQEILSLRKKELHITELSHNLLPLFEIESKIHHELNFIFQVCNTHPKLLREKKFLYIRDIVLDKSSLLWKNINEYNRYLTVYNTMIQRKNLSIIWLVLPFTQKELLK